MLQVFVCVCVCCVKAEVSTPTHKTKQKNKKQIAMEALPVFLDRLFAPWLAILISVTFVLAFGEILPQALFAAGMQNCVFFTFFFVSFLALCYA